MARMVARASQRALKLRAFARRSFAFTLEKQHLDWVEVRRIGREEKKSGADGRHRIVDRLSFVTAEIVENDDIARPQRRHEEFSDIGAEQGAVDGSVDEAGCGDTRRAQAGKERERLPMAMRCAPGEPLAAR